MIERTELGSGDVPLVRASADGASEKVNWAWE